MYADGIPLDGMSNTKVDRWDYLDLSARLRRADGSKIENRFSIGDFGTLIKMPLARRNEREHEICD